MNLYTYAHRKLRGRWAKLVDEGDVACARCGLFLVPGSPWDLGHSDDGLAWTGPEHARCNRRAAGLASAARRPSRRRTPEAHPGLLPAPPSPATQQALGARQTTHPTTALPIAGVPDRHPATQQRSAPICEPPHPLGGAPTTPPATVTVPYSGSPSVRVWDSRAGGCDGR